MATRFRRDCLGFMALIVCEVPRWKVPAAPSLVADPLRLSRAVSQSSNFFREVLAHPSLAMEKQIKSTMTKLEKKKKLTEKDKKLTTLEEHFDAYDAAMEAYLNRH